MSDNNVVSLSEKAGKYLTFRLQNEEYGVEILKVREIIGMIDITSVPRTPDFVKGVINLRGRVIPVIDLRLRFGLEEVEYTEKTCIIVVEIGVDDTNIQLGVIVDSVSEVLNVSPDDLQETPKFGISLNTDFILGMAKSNDTVRTLLDIDKVLGSAEIDEMLDNVKTE